MKVKVSISLDSRLIGVIDRMSGNRSETIEKLVVKSLGMDRLKRALILAGGSGSRLRPITYEIPKPLIPVRGKPVLLWQIDSLRKNGLEDLTVSVGYKAEKIIKETPARPDVSYVIEKEPLGTGGALKLFGKEYSSDSPFLVMNCDALFSPFPNIQDLFDFHNTYKCLATMLLVSAENCNQGVARLKGSMITDFMEKPKDIRHGLISAGVYIFRPDIFSRLGKVCSLEKDIFPALARAGELAGYVYDGRIWDIGSNEGYGKALNEWRPDG
jgi:NDP-sugar pyrophosphorylase family protein